MPPDLGMVLVSPGFKFKSLVDLPVWNPKTQGCL